MSETNPVTMASPTTARILVGEADPDVRREIRDALSRSGYDVIAEASSGRQLVDLSRRLQPDLTIVDVDLSESSGVDAASAVLAEDISPVVLMADPATDAAFASRKLKVTGFLVKPVSATALIPVVELALARYADIRALRERVAELEDALETRKLVERAKGILMDLHGLSEADAFRRMRKTSMDNRKTMREVAEAILLSHDLQLGSEAI
ncbi:MAG: ANTAR domain-containing protein [Thermomicrobiales bacterium]